MGGGVHGTDRRQANRCLIDRRFLTAVLPFFHSFLTNLFHFEDTMNVPGDLLYTKDHEWVRVDGDLAVVGITEFAQGELGDVVFVQLPDAGKVVKQGDSFGTIEAVKAVSDIYSPLSGSIVEINSALGDAPETINQDAFGKGWIVKIKPTNLAGERGNLLTPAAYKDLTSA
jgi:glycine cleavage system H protein